MCGAVHIVQSGPIGKGVCVRASRAKKLSNSTKLIGKICTQEDMRGRSAHAVGWNASLRRSLMAHRAQRKKVSLEHIRHCGTKINHTHIVQIPKPIYKYSYIQSGRTSSPYNDRTLLQPYRQPYQLAPPLMLSANIRIRDDDVYFMTNICISN